MPLELTVRKPGTLMARLMKTEISDEQYAAIVALLSAPDDWVLVRRETVERPARRFGFQFRKEDE